MAIRNGTSILALSATAWGLICRYRSSSGYIVTVWAVVFGKSTCCATRTSIGLSVRPRSNCAPEEASLEFCDRGPEEDELVLMEPLLEPLRWLVLSRGRPECFLRSMFRRRVELRPGTSLLGGVTDEALKFPANLPDPTLLVELHDCG